MAELDALTRKLCPACGAQAVWTPEKQSLVCPSCGTESSFTPTDAPIKEHALLEALKNVPDDKRGWATEKKSVRCQHCNAVSVFDPEKVGKNCEFCGSAQLIPYDEIESPFRPESVLAFKIGNSQVRDILKSWYKKVWFAPNNLSKLGMADILHGIYIPYWTFDAQVDASWTAEAGYYYYTTESYTDSQGNRQTKQVRHTRWENARGDFSHFFDDQLVAASLGVNQTLLSKVEPFPTQELSPYDPSYVTGWTVEQYQVDLHNAARNSSERMNQQLEEMIIKQIPGDTYRSLQVYPQYSAQTFKHILVPIWLVTYTYGKRSFQVVVNGSTAAIAGEYPKSWIKITLAVLATLALIVIVALILQSK